MKFISESIIDQKAAAVGATDDFSGLIESLKENQPAVLAFLLSESFDLLTQSEKDYAMFLTLVIWESIREVHPEQSAIDPQSIEKAEDENWEKISTASAKGFREKLDVFFENSPQEDLLAFLEDALMHDEDDSITKEGREYVFIAVKTIIDCLDQVIIDQ